MGVDCSDVLRRLGSEARVKKFLMKILEDQSFSHLLSALEDENYEEAFRCAHSLKGVCLNLDLDPLQASSSELTEALRGGAPEGDISSLVEQVKLDYENMVRLVSQL